jgi:hypothetical protein
MPLERSAQDVTSVEGILRAMYEVISGPAGQARDWERFRSLYLPEARLMPVVATAEKPHVRVLSPEDYIRRVEPIFAREDFWERETGREVATFGRVAHVLRPLRVAARPQRPAVRDRDEQRAAVLRRGALVDRERDVEHEQERVIAKSADGLVFLR